MKGARYRWLAGTVLAVIAVAAALALVDDEPRFEGRALSDWLDDPKLGASEIQRGVRAIGTNALPHLQAWLQQKPALLERTLRGVDTRFDYLGLGYHPSLEANQRAMRGFITLGELAAPAISWLEGGAIRKDADFEFYLKALAATGPEGIAVLERLLAGATIKEKSFFINALAFASGTHPEAAALLAGFLADPDVNLRLRAMWAIRDLGADCPPALADALRARGGQEPDGSLRATAQLLSGIVDKSREANSRPSGGRN